MNLKKLKITKNYFEKSDQKSVFISFLNIFFTNNYNKILKNIIKTLLFIN